MLVRLLLCLLLLSGAASVSPAIAQPAAATSGVGARSGPIDFGGQGTLGPTLGSLALISLAPLTTATPTDRYYDNNWLVVNDSKLYRQRNIVCRFTAGSPVVTDCPRTAGATVGNFLQEETRDDGSLVRPPGASFPAGTRIASGLTGSGFTMSAPARITGQRAVSVVGQCGNAAFIFPSSQPNGLPGDGYVSGAIGQSMAGDGCQGFHSGMRRGAAGGVIGFGLLYREAAYLMPAGAGKYTDIGDVITHDPQADYLPGVSWVAYGVNGQTGDITFRDHTNAPILTLFEATRTASFNGAISIGQRADNGRAAAGVALAVHGHAAIGCGSADTAGALALAVTCDAAQSGIGYRYRDLGTTAVSYNRTDGGVLAASGQALSLKVGMTGDDPTTGVSVLRLDDGVAALRGHFASIGRQPALDHCGTAPALSAQSTDRSGTVTVGVGAVKSCRLTFAAAYAAAPKCVVSGQVNGVPVAMAVTARLASGVTVGFATAMGGGEFDYICEQ